MRFQLLRQSFNRSSGNAILLCPLFIPHNGLFGLSPKVRVRIKTQRLEVQAIIQSRTHLVSNFPQTVIACFVRQHHVEVNRWVTAPILADPKTDVHHVWCQHPLHIGDSFGDFDFFSHC